MKNTWIGILIVVLFAFSCTENDQVVPRTNPRFSVTLVQEISEKGAEFEASMYDYGSDPIEEYGFVYSLNDRPKLGVSESVSKSGQPDANFKLTGDHSMIKGKKYYVAAYIKTQKGVVYSIPVEFISQGSGGFIFKKLEGGPLVYYGDTLTVYGEKFSTVPANYEVKVNGSNASILDIDTNGFKVIIPNELRFGYPFDYDGKLVITIKILEKTLEINSDIQFQEPIFYDSNQEFKYDENFIIKGEYLRDANLNLIYPNYNIETVNNTDSLIEFRTNAGFESLKPEFGLYLRGKYYEIKDIIKIQTTEILPNQQLKIGSIYSQLWIKGTNFNSVNQYNNIFVSNVEQQSIYVDQVTADEARISINTFAVPRPRFYKIWAFNGGVKSTNFVTVEDTEPTLAFMNTSSFPFNANADGRSVNWKDKAIWLLDGKITEVNPKNKSGRILKYVDIKNGNIASSFAVINQDVVYFAGSTNAITNTPGKFYSYDLNSGSLIELPAIPSKASTPKSVFVSGDFLYFGGGFYKDEVDVRKVAEGYKFNLKSKTWTTWDKKFPISDYWDFETTFMHNGQVYGLVNEINDSDFRATRLMRFDQSQEDWIELATYPYLGYANGNVAMPIGDAVYVFMNEVLLKIDMNNYKQTRIIGVSVYDRSYTGPPLIFISEGKIYYSDYNGYLLNEVDPAYFRE